MTPEYKGRPITDDILERMLLSDTNDLTSHHHIERVVSSLDGTATLGPDPGSGDILSYFCLISSWLCADRRKQSRIESGQSAFLRCDMVQTRRSVEQTLKQTNCPLMNWLSHRGSWWRHQMETFSALLAIFAGNSPVPDEFPTQRPVTRSFDVFFDLRPNKRLSKQWRGWWFETQSRSLWRHRKVKLRIKLDNWSWWWASTLFYRMMAYPMII